MRPHLKFIVLFAIIFAPILTWAEPIDGIVAVVGDEVILLSELEEVRQGFEQQPGFQRLPPADQRKELLNRLIEDKVLLVKAKQDTTIKISDKEITPRVEDHVNRLIDQQGGEKKLELLLMQTNGMNLAQFRAKLNNTFHDQMYKQRMQMKYVGDRDPTQEQVRDFFTHYQDSLPTQQNSVKLLHLQLKIKANEILEKAVYNRIDSLLARLNKGESFAELAKNYSQDGSGKDGGDIGFTKYGVLDPDYEKAAFAMELGDYTQKPIKSRYGYHLIKVTGKKDNEIKTSHILLRVIPDSKDSVRAQFVCDSLRKVALSQKNFADLAMKYSDDRKTKEKGGNLGWFTKDQIDPNYASEIDTLNENDITRPLLIADSYHLFLVDKKKDERRLSLTEDWVQISQVAKNYYSNKKLASFVEKWKETVHIENKLAQFKLDASEEKSAPEKANLTAPN